MKTILQSITDRVSTKRGMWTTLIAWFLITMILAIFAPSVKDYQVSSIDTLPEDAKSVVAQKKIDHYFKDNDGIPAILVFQAKDGQVELQELSQLLDKISEKNITGVEQLIPLSKLPPEATKEFFSEDQTTAIIPLTYATTMESKEIKEANEQLQMLAKESAQYDLYITGPAGIAADTLELFSRADVVLILSTVGLILVLLIVIYRSPLLALIPLLAAAFVYEVVMQILGLIGRAGLVLSSQTISIMSILLFAAVIDYSLFVFSRYREELKKHEDKFIAMKEAMRETGVPVFFSGGTVLAAMLVLFFAKFGDYRNFAPTFATTMAIIMLASITLVPALFMLFGRKSFWPKVPHVGEETVKSHSFWSKVGRFVVKKPGLAILAISIFLILSASHLFKLEYEFDTMKSFPEDMPSRHGYEILEDKFAKGDLAPTSVLLEGKEPFTQDDIVNVQNQLENEKIVENIRINGISEDQKAANFSLTLSESPYSLEAINAMEKIINNGEEILKESNTEGELYFAGETASLVDEREINNRDVFVIVILETLLIFLLLIVLTKSIKMPIYMMGTILVSFFAALGLGTFLTDLFFDINTVSDRVPLYAFVFLVALGIDYNIMLISRYQEERKRHTVKEAVEIAVANTGGVISSAGLILAATFAVLMTQPIQLLFVFGFIVAVGILLDTFLIRGVLLPALLTIFEKDKQKSVNS